VARGNLSPEKQTQLREENSRKRAAEVRDRVLCGETFFCFCTSSVSKIVRAGTFCPYSVCLSVRPSVCPPGYYFSLLSMCFKNNILSSSHILICNLSAYVYVSMNLRIATAPL
jgi:hypothetical protein